MINFNCIHFHVMSFHVKTLNSIRYVNLSWIKIFFLWSQLWKRLNNWNSFFLFFLNQWALNKLQVVNAELSGTSKTWWRVWSGHIHMVVGIAESWREVLYSSLIRYIYVCEIDKITEGKNLKCIGVDIFCWCGLTFKETNMKESSSL